MTKTLLCILTLATFQSFAQVGRISGKVVYKPDSTGLPGVTILVAGTGAISDMEGNFKIDSLQSGTYDLILHDLGLGQDTIRNVVVQSNSTTTLNLALPSWNCSTATVNVCPIGNKSDEVIPIVYGLPTNKTFRKAKRGKVQLGGCILSGCDPEWYCKRHQSAF